MKFMSILIAALFSGSLFAKSADDGDYLVKLAPGNSARIFSMQSMMPTGTQVEDLGIAGWTRVKVPASAVRAFSATSLKNLPFVIKVQPNYKIKLLDNPALANEQVRQAIAERILAGGGFPGGGEPAG